MRLLVLDGPEYRARGLLRRRDAVLVHSDQRTEHFSCNRRWNAQLARDIDGAGPFVGIGCSLGALALLYLHWTHPGQLEGLLLQSGSFFHSHTERYERHFVRFERVHRFVDRVLHDRGRPPRIPITMTCGLEEENRDNNRPFADALAAHGWDIRLVEHPGGHDWDAWQLALNEELPPLLRRVERARRG